MAKWYDPFLTKDERRLQVGQKGIRARNRAKEMGVNTGEPKQVPNDRSTAVSRSNRTGIIRENAQRQNGGKTVIRAIQNSDTRQRIAQALSRPTATKRGVAYNQNAQMNASDKKKKR